MKAIDSDEHAKAPEPTPSKGHNHDDDDSKKRHDDDDHHRKKRYDDDDNDDRYGKGSKDDCCEKSKKDCHCGSKHARVLSNTVSASTYKEIISTITRFTVSTGVATSNEWRDFLPKLMTTYRDGYIISGQDEVSVIPTSFFYPEWWLKQVGYYDIPANPNGIMFDANPIMIHTQSFMVTLFMTVALCGSIGYFMAKRKYSGVSFVSH
jgi:hypothetical protein